MSRSGRRRRYSAREHEMHERRRRDDYDVIDVICDRCGTTYEAGVLDDHPSEACIAQQEANVAGDVPAERAAAA